MLKNTVNRKNIWIAIIGALVVLVILDLTPIGGNTKFYVKWAECGQRPVYTRQGGGFTSVVPNYVNTPNFGFMRGFMPYFCTPQQAEQNGYSSDQRVYSFPHLPKSEWQSSIQKARSIMSR